MMRLYRLLLLFYPASFRAEYGEQMLRVFAARRQGAKGISGRMALWVDALFDVVISAAQAHGDILRQDLRYCWRTFRQSPGFALTAVGIMALGIGATTAAFSVTDHVLLRPLPYLQPQNMVRIWESPPNYSQMEPSPPNYMDWKKVSASFESMGALRGWAANLVGEGEPQRIGVQAVTSEVLPMLGVAPLAGRSFTPEEEQQGAERTAILSYGLWQSTFGGNLAILGKQVLLDGRPHTVVGVMPAHFFFPDRETKLWVPLQFTPNDHTDRNNNELNVVARLKTGISLEQARGEMRGVAAQLEKAYPQENEKTGITVNLLHSEIADQPRVMLLALLGASLCLLLIACTNVANLFLARALARRRELAVRSALGAGRDRLTRQLLTESLSIALAGGALGAAVAITALPLLTRLVPSNLPIAQTPSVDLRVLGFALALTLLTGVIFGLVPAWRVCWAAGASGLREGVRAGGGRRERFRSALVIAEVCASVVLLVCAGLLLGALWRVQAVDAGFRSDNVLTLRTALPFPKYRTVAARHQFYSKVLADAAALPGVTHTAYITYLPMTMRGGIWGVSLDGTPADRAGTSTASLRYVTPGFFAAMGIPLKQGRDVSEVDTQTALFTAVVSESFAERFWPGQDPIGRTFEFALAKRTVVGVVGNVRVRGLERNSEPQVYLPFQQAPDGGLLGYIPRDLVIRASNAEALIPAVRRIIHDADPQQPVSDVRMLADIVGGETAPRQAQLRVILGFAALAFLLAGVGIHGLLSYAVSQRTNEIGVRIALGAQRSDILAMILREGAVLAAIGIAVGAALAYAAARSMEALLFGVPPGDLVTMAAAVGLSVVMSLAGSLLPAVRAMRVDPTTAIRAE